MKIALLSSLLSVVLLTGCQPSGQQQSAPETTTNTTNETKQSAEATKSEGAQQEQQATPAGAGNEVAVIKTSEGDMVVEFWPEVAPKTVENFKKLARDKFYDGTAFHRIVKGFMIQGGDPLTKDVANEARFGTGDPGYKIKAEFNDRSHQRGVLSMARSQHPDSAGSQFFIVHGDASFLDGQYTAFGKVIKGDDVLEKIANTPVVTGPGGERSKPTKRVEVKSIEIVAADSIK